MAAYLLSHGWQSQTFSGRSWWRDPVVGGWLKLAVAYRVQRYRDITGRDPLK